MSKRKIVIIFVLIVPLFIILALLNITQLDARIQTEQGNQSISEGIDNKDNAPVEEEPSDQEETDGEEDLAENPPDQSNSENKGPGQSLNDAADMLILVNKETSLAPDYTPDDLTVPNVRFSFEGPDPKQNIRQVAAAALEELFAGAEEAGFYLFAVSGYRSYSRQETVYTGHVERLGETEANKISAKPGHSEHQTGLAMDITSESASFSLSQKFGETGEGKWVAKNAHRYGFIIRYQKGKEDLTGYSYEPWHLRYVGKEAAQEIFEKDLTLEAYLENR